jgi:ABC-2 type transport system ATP-binding protein
MIEVRDLRKTYPGGAEAVRGVSFDVAEGEFFGFLGPNGAGKSTTINMLVNLVKRTSGSISIDGLSLDEHQNEIYGRVGFAMQEVGLDETATAREMLELHGRLYHMPPAKIQSQIAKLLKLVELEKVADKYTSTYSGGMRRRFDLALSLIHEPKLLFLDEPTNGLDPKGREEMLDLIRGISHGKGVNVLVSSHVLRDIERVCDSVVVVMRGQLRASGRIEDLKRIEGQPLDVEVRETSNAFVNALMAEGAMVGPPKSNVYRVQLSGGIVQAHQRVQSVARRTGTQIRGFRVAERSLEEAFLDAIQPGEPPKIMHAEGGSN